MNAQQAVRSQLQFWHGTLDQVLSDCTPEAFNNPVPGGKISQIGAIYAHAVLSEDAIVHGLLQGKPLIFQTGGWEPKTGVTFDGRPMLTPEWASSLKFDMKPFQDYSHEVYKAVDDYLAQLPDGEMDRKTQGPLGETTVGFMVTNILGTHTIGHTGEIAALKGVQGMKGLPF